VSSLRYILEKFFIYAEKTLDLVFDATAGCVVQSKDFKPGHSKGKRDKLSSSALDRYFSDNPEKTKELGLVIPYPKNLPTETLYKLLSSNTHEPPLLTIYIRKKDRAPYNAFMSDLGRCFSKEVEEVDDDEAAAGKIFRLG
jgi:hypothetical protein